MTNGAVSEEKSYPKTMVICSNLHRRRMTMALISFWEVCAKMGETVAKLLYEQWLAEPLQTTVILLPTIFLSRLHHQSKSGCSLNRILY
jgi:hypothetical protein